MPFLTAGSSIGERVKVFENEDLMVLDFKEEEGGSVMREVVFKDKPEQTQSEV